MTNNSNNEFNEFENTDIERMDEEQHRQKPTGFSANLSEAWRTRPGFKLLVLMIAVAGIVAASVGFFSSHKSATEVSKIANPPNIHEAPGGQASPFVQDQTRIADQQRADQALNGNGSALPTPLGQNADIGDLLNRNKSDPLNELRNQVLQLQKQQADQQQRGQGQQQGQNQAQPQQFDDTLAQAMQRQMQQLSEGWTPKGIKQVDVVKADDLKHERDSQSSSSSAASAQNASSAAALAPMIVPAGTVSYAQLLTEANSDVPGPILAQIVSGPLAGARVTGKFKVANNYADYLVLEFNLAARKGKEYQINAVALDPDTTLGGLATEVDQRYFTRVILPAAAGFLQGFGQALGQNSITTTTNGQFAITEQSKAGVQQGIYQGLGQASNTASQFFQNQANLVKPLVRVAAGTPIGMFFVTSVFDSSGLPQGSYVGPDGRVVNAQQNLYGTAGQQGAQNPYAAALAAASPYLGGNAGGLGGLGGAGTGLGASYPGTTVTGYGGNAANSSNAGGSSGVPYPNYATQTPLYNNAPLTVSPGVGAYGYR